MSETDDGTRTEVDRATVEKALRAWAGGTGASKLGRGFSYPERFDGLAAWLIDGPVAAVLDGLGYVIVEEAPG